MKEYLFVEKSLNPFGLPTPEMALATLDVDYFAGTCDMETALSSLMRLQLGHMLPLASFQLLGRSEYHIHRSHIH